MDILLARHLAGTLVAYRRFASSGRPGEHKTPAVTFRGRSRTCVICNGNQDKRYHAAATQGIPLFGQG
jgi:hypothetical protein